MNCPKCGSAEVRRSHHHKTRDLLESPFGRIAYRCRKCRNRFYADNDGTPVQHRPRSRNSGPKRGTRRLRRWMVEAAIFAIMLLLFLVFLRYVTREPSPSPQGSRTLFDSAGSITV